MESAEDEHYRQMLFATMLLCLPACASVSVDITERQKPYSSLKDRDVTISSMREIDPEERRREIFTRETLLVNKSKERTLATVNIADSANDPAPMQFDIRKEKRAYMVEAPLLPENGFSPHLAVGRHSDQKFLAILRWRVNF